MHKVEVAAYAIGFVAEKKLLVRAFEEKELLCCPEQVVALPVVAY